MKPVSVASMCLLLASLMGACQPDRASPDVASTESQPKAMQSPSIEAPRQSGSSSDHSPSAIATEPDSGPTEARSPEIGPVALTEDMVPPEKISGDPFDFQNPPCRVRLGGIIFRSVIDEQGQVRDLEFLKPVDPCVETAVRDALGTWQFRPATLDGVPVAVYYNMSVHIRLQ